MTLGLTQSHANWDQMIFKFPVKERQQRREIVISPHMLWAWNVETYTSDPNSSFCIGMTSEFTSHK